jgi:hypothetical protein
VGGGAHRGAAGRSRRDAEVAIGGRRDGEASGARMREGGKRSGGLGRDSLGYLLASPAMAMASDSYKKPRGG